MPWVPRSTLTRELSAGLECTSPCNPFRSICWSPCTRITVPAGGGQDGPGPIPRSRLTRVKTNSEEQSVASNFSRVPSGTCIQSSALSKTGDGRPRWSSLTRLEGSSWHALAQHTQSSGVWVSHRTALTSARAVRVSRATPCAEREKKWHTGMLFRRTSTRSVIQGGLVRGCLDGRWWPT